MNGRRLATLAFSLLAGAANVHAQALDTTLSLRGDAWSGSRQLDDAGAIARSSAWGRAKLSLGDAGRVVADAWVGAQTRDPQAGQRGVVRELYWRIDTGPLSWTLGRQMPVWGRADGLNPTDQLSPRDFTLLVPEDSEQRRGNQAVQAAADLGFGNLSVFWFPRAASHTIPLQAVPGVSVLREEPPRRSMTAVKLDLAGEGIDGSISYFDGSDPLPDLAVAGLSAGGLILSLRNQPLRVLGADLSLTHDGVVWRAEAAWMDTANSGPDDYTRKKPRLWLVAGAEWTLPGSTTLGLQASLQKVMDYRSPDSLADPVQREVAWRQAAIANQTSAHQFGLLWRLASRWRNDTLMAEMSGVIMSSPRSGLWRTRLTWSIDDHWQLLAGTDVYFGPPHSLWGQFRDNRLATVQLRRGW